MQRGPGQMRDRRLERIEAIIERQQRMPAECDDEGFLLADSTVEWAPSVPSAVVVDWSRFRHLATVFGLMP